MAKYIMVIIIIIFIILGVLMFLVGKYCKKKPLKIFLATIISLITICLVFLSIDINRVNTFRKPIFMWEIENKCGDRCSSYLGLGYKVDITYYDNNVIEKIEMYMFDKVIAGAVQDIINEELCKTNDFVEIVGEITKISQNTRTEDQQGNILINIISGLDEADDIIFYHNSNIIFKIGQKVKIMYNGNLDYSNPPLGYAECIEIIE